MECRNETPGFRVRALVENLPLVGIQRCRSKHRRRDGKVVGRKIFKEPERKRERSHGTCRGRPEPFFDSWSLAPDGFESLGHDGTCSACSGPRNEVDELAPPYGRVVTILRRLIEDSHETIVEAHCWLFSLERTLVSLYASVYNALRSYCLTVP